MILDLNMMKMNGIHQDGMIINYNHGIQNLQTHWLQLKILHQ